MAQAVMLLMRGKDITQAIGRVGLKVEPVLGPEIALAVARAIWAQNRRMRTEWIFQGPNTSWP